MFIMFLQNKRVNFAGKGKVFLKCKGEISKISKYLSRLILMISVLKVSISKLTLEKRKLMSKQERMKFAQENMTDLDKFIFVCNKSSQKVESQKKCESAVNLVSKVENKKMCEHCVNLVPKLSNRKKHDSGVNLVPKSCYEAIALCNETVEEVVPEKIVDNNSTSWQKTRLRTHYKKQRNNVLLLQNNVKKKRRRICLVLPGCEDQNKSVMNSENSNSKQCPLELLSNDKDSNTSKINSGNCKPKVENQKRCEICVNLVPKSCYEAISLCKETVEVVVPENIIDTGSRRQWKTSVRTHYKNLGDNFLSLEKIIKKKESRRLPGHPGCEDQDSHIMNCESSNSKQCCLTPLTNGENSNNSTINSGNWKEDILSLDPLQKNRKEGRGGGERQRISPELPGCEDQGRPVMTCKNLNSKQCCLTPLTNCENSNNSKINSGKWKEDILSLDPLQKNRKKERGGEERQRISPELTGCEDQGRLVMNCKNMKSKQCPLKPLGNSEDSNSTKINSGNCKEDILSLDPLQKNRKEETGGRERQRIPSECTGCEDQGRPVMNSKNLNSKQCPFKPLSNSEDNNSSKINSGNCKPKVENRKRCEICVNLVPRSCYEAISLCKETVEVVVPGNIIDTSSRPRWKTRMRTHYKNLGDNFLALEKNIKMEKNIKKKQRRRLPGLPGCEGQDSHIMNCESSNSKQCCLTPLTNGENSNNSKVNSGNCKEDILSLDPLQKNRKKETGGGERQRIPSELPGCKDQGRPVMNSKNLNSKKCPLKPLSNSEDGNSTKINSGNCKQNFLSLDPLQKNRKKEREGGGEQLRRRIIDLELPRCEVQDRFIMNCENLKCKQCPLEPLTNYEHSNSSKIKSGNCKQDCLSLHPLQKNTKKKGGEGGKRSKQRINPDLLACKDHDMNCENSKRKKIPVEPLSYGENSNSHKIKSVNCKQDVLSLDPLQKNTKKKGGGGRRRRRKISPGLQGRKDKDRPVTDCESSKSKECPLGPLQNGTENKTCKINSDICKQDILSLDALQKNTKKKKKKGGRKRGLFRGFPRSEYQDTSGMNTENSKCEQCPLEPLNNGVDTSSIKIDNGNCKQVSSVGKHTDTRHKILLLSDSHGRHCAGLLNQTLPSKYFASSTIKPSAQMKHVVSNIEEMIKDFNKLDCLIILAGANDIQTDFRDFQCTVNELLSNTTNTRVIMCTVPYRFDRADWNERIYEINEFLVESALQCSHAKIVDVNGFLRKRDYTRHGLHLVMKGKEKLCRNLHGFAMLQPITPSLITVSCSQKVELKNESSQSSKILEATNKTDNEAVMKAIPPRKKTVEEAVAAPQNNTKKKKRRSRRWRKKKSKTPKE